MNNLLLMIAVLAAAGSLAFVGLMPADSGPALMITLPLAVGGCFAISKIKEDENFLVRLFVAAIMARIFVGSAIFYFHQQAFFGGDAETFDIFGYALLKTWDGDFSNQYYVDRFMGGGASSGWGMMYMVAAIYKIVGRNMLATQYVNSVIGAATAPVAYLMAMEIFPNKKVARATALLTAFFPSLILWTCQGLKDGPIIFLLTLSMLATLKLGNRFNFKYVAVLATGLFCLMTLRFYVFYIIAFSIVCAFIMGRRKLSAQAFLRQFIIMFVIGMALAALGVTQLAGSQLDRYANLQQVQVVRNDLSRSAATGFGQDIDVSTPEGALSAIPLGLSYLLLAPFPWHFSSVRQMITLPEMMIWWSSIPFLVFGLWFTIKHRLREVAPIVIFVSLLTISYSIVQGNVGTAYRQRAQLLIFYFIFVAVGFALFKEKREKRSQQRSTAPEAPRATVEWSPEKRKRQLPVASQT